MDSDKGFWILMFSVLLIVLSAFFISLHFLKLNNYGSEIFADNMLSHEVSDDGNNIKNSSNELNFIDYDNFMNDDISSLDRTLVQKSFDSCHGDISRKQEEYFSCVKNYITHLASRSDNPEICLFLKEKDSQVSCKDNIIFKRVTDKYIEESNNLENPHITPSNINECKNMILEQNRIDCFNILERFTGVGE